MVVKAQVNSSTIKGMIIDQESGSPIAGATILLLTPGTKKGAISNEAGTFRIEEVPVGRHTIRITMSGYTSQEKGNLQLVSGKELDIEVGLEEVMTTLEDVVITDEISRKTPANQMQTVSSRTFSIEEAGRYSGALQDPARMAQNFAGVSGASDDRNDIIIRGNSPTGLLWRLEGIDIPSPNHFSSLGSTGGPVSMLNINNLKNSDFTTGAFAPEYGNALSGVFDLKLRKGNSDKREYLAQVGFNGFEVGIEGPFVKGKNASYLGNYRYSTLGLIGALGINLGTGAAIPQFQDLTYKIHLPTRKAGTFNFFGIGGLSYIELKADPDDKDNLYTAQSQNINFRSNTGIVGMSHTYFFDTKTSSKLVLAYSGTQSATDVDSIDVNTGSTFDFFGSKNQKIRLSANYKIKRKFNARNTAAVGLIADQYALDVQDSVFDFSNSNWRRSASFQGNLTMLQAYIQWKHRFTESLSLVSGLHSQYYIQNGSNVIEPRIGLQYRLTESHSLSFASGLHSQLQPLPVYFVTTQDIEGNELLPNKALDFTKSLHLVLGYDFFINKNLHLKAETYFQRLFNVPIDSSASSFSMLNAGRDFIIPGRSGLVNEGTGYNYGLELTMERSFARGYYFLTTLSLFKSRYEGSDGIERNTAFNGNYVVNALGGKEFKLGKNNTFGLDTKITYAGGTRFTPVDLPASIIVGSEIRDQNMAFQSQYPDYFRLDFKLTFRMNRPKWAQQFSVDLQNLTGRKNIFQYGYNPSTQRIGTVYQRGFFPDVQYKVYF